VAFVTIANQTLVNQVHNSAVTVPGDADYDGIPDALEADLVNQLPIIRMPGGVCAAR
jgi:hypothetical protein